MFDEGTGTSASRTDNGAETVSWPDGGITPFHGEKGTTYEGGFRVALLVRWPGVIESGAIDTGTISREDWMPTLLAAAGDPDIVAELKQGHNANGKTFKVHADGYSLLPYVKGEVEESPRKSMIYFGQGGELNAVRDGNWKVHFAQTPGNIASGVREVTGWPMIAHLRADPYERMMFEAELGYMRWYADSIWFFVPIQSLLKEFISTLSACFFQEGSSLNAAGINYQSLRAAAAMKRLQEIEGLVPPIGR